jgi:hypothetical protein
MISVIALLALTGLITTVGGSKTGRLLPLSK